MNLKNVKMNYKDEFIQSQTDASCTYYLMYDIFYLQPPPKNRNRSE